MTEILAADNHRIKTKNGKWRLAYNDRPLAEGSDKGFRYSGRFGSTRRLPEGGIIYQSDIRQVVLGWQATDESWHLGLIVAPHLAEQRGSRWCEVVHWPDPDITVFQDLAQTTGQHLAQSIGVPFYVIPPQRDTAPPPPLRDLPELPLRFGDWQIEALPSDKRKTNSQGTPEKGRYVIKRTSGWIARRMFRTGWFIILTSVYLVLSLATIFGKIALPTTGTLVPDPQFLPYLGLAISGSLALAALLQFFGTVFSMDRIVIDSRRGISAWNGKRHLWDITEAEIQSMYVSEVVKKREQAPATEYGELNIHLGGGKFQHILSQQYPEDNSDTPQPELVFPRTENIREMSRDVVHTNLQGAGMYIAEAFSNIPVWYDMRVK